MAAGAGRGVMQRSEGSIARGTRIVVHAGESKGSPYEGRAGTVLASRRVLGVTICSVLLDATAGKGSPVELFASELTATPGGQASAAPPATTGTSATNVAHLFDKAWEEKEFADLADAPVEALQGVSPGDAALLRGALGITTVRDLATNKYVLWAQAITKFANAS